ncbi:MAG: hypothetical protein KF773_27930 [Deltaproteobacteria bacterium]|nr:hypothetical protein [Deltaproteobacteria bacterium]
MKKLATVALLLAAACRGRGDEVQGVVFGEGPTDHAEAGLASAPSALGLAGTWEVTLDPRDRTLRRATGGGHDRFDIASDADAVRAAMQVYRTSRLAEYALEVDGSAGVDDVWTVQLRQLYGGVPVVGAHVGITFNHGRVVLVQGRLFDVDTSLTIESPLEAAFVEVDRALAGLEDGAGDTGRLVVVPGHPTFRLAWEVTSHKRERDVVAYVDAHTNELFHAYDARAYDSSDPPLARGGYPGAITNDVDARTVGDDVLSEAGAFQHARAGDATVTSDANGVFRFPASVGRLRDDAGGPIAVNAGMRGPYADVRNKRGPGARYTGTIRAGQPVIVGWNDHNSRADERDTFRGTNVTNRFVATVFPNLAWINRPLVANVNHGYTCNAYWDGSTINFFRESAQCNNTGRIFDVIAHEWGHGLDQNAPGGVQDRALGEFIGDLVSFVQTRDAKLGPGFFVDGGGAVRDLEDPAFACYDPRRTEVHDAGQFLGAIVWDIYKDLRALGLDGEELKRLMLLPIAIGQTRSQWYSAMLAVDDDDGNLANGTPHECLIYDRFEQHSCKGARYPGIPAKRPSHCK